MFLSLFKISKIRAGVLSRKVFQEGSFGSIKMQYASNSLQFLANEEKLEQALLEWHSISS